MRRTLWLAIAKLIGLATLTLALAAPIPSAWKEQVLYNFQGGTTDGFWPIGGVVFDKTGNMYGATVGAGSGSCTPDAYECGLVYQLSPPIKKGDAWTENILVQFKGEESKDAASPTGGLIIDSTGNLYGVTGYGGTGDCVLLGTPAGCGTVYEISPPKQKGGNWTEAILYSFQGGNDGYFPNGNLTLDKAGNLYGATAFGGGKGNSCNEFYGGNCGTVFKLSVPKKKGGTWRETILHSFAGLVSGKQSGDGASPNGGLIFDRKGAIYGTSYIGGYNCPHSSNQGCGAVFKLSSSKSNGGVWKESTLYRFKGIPDAASPAAGLVERHGTLYGTTLAGGVGHNGGSPFGTVFKLSPNADGSWSEALLHSFQDGYDGAVPRAKVVFGPRGDLYGTATVGGANLAGTVFKLDEREHWKLTPLYNFNGVGQNDGAGPGDIVFNSTGAMFGTTQSGGSGTACRQSGCGTVFSLKP